MQKVVITSPNFDSVRGFLSCCEGGKLIYDSIPVQLGAKGKSANKKEGDCKTPIGTFPIGSAFGNKEHAHYAKHLPFILITKNLECVDDPNSIYYNQLVYCNQIDRPDWKSSEKMHEIGELYNLGLVVNYNQNPTIPHKGSAIFIHQTNPNHEGTLGCIALEKQDLIKLVSWLNPNLSPHLSIS